MKQSYWLQEPAHFVRSDAKIACTPDGNRVSGGEGGGVVFETFPPGGQIAGFMIFGRKGCVREGGA